MQRHAVIAAALISLCILSACTDPPKPPPPNKLQERESRFWRRPDPSSAPAAGTPGSSSSSSSRPDGPPLNVEDAPLPFEVSEKTNAALDIACADGHPAAAEITRTEPVEVTPEGEKGLLLTIRHACICSASGNCPHQVWTLDANLRFKKSLDDEGYELLLANTVHNGHYDVITEAYLTPRESTILRYEWDGAEYHPVEQSCRRGTGDIPTRKIFAGKCR